jgi:cysteine desulfurase/selenocysteine lyase
MPEATAFPVDRIRVDFEGARSAVYLNTAAEGLFLDSHRDALARYATQKALGSTGREECVSVESRCRSLVAQVLNVKAQDVAFIASTARGLDAVIGAIDWRAGDNIVITDAEFPTTNYAAELLGKRGVETRVVTSREGALRLDEFEEKIDGRSRLVAVSAVSFRHGFKIDLEGLGRVAHAKNALLFVDAIQAVGVVPIDANPADFLTFGTYKWQLGCHGIAALYVNPAIVGEIEPPYVAYRSVANLFPLDPREQYELWPDARRFEEGMPNYPAMFVLENAMRYLLELRIDRISNYVGSLVDRIYNGLEELGVTPLTTRSRSERAGIVSFESPNAAHLLAGLAESGIVAWGRDGRLRMAPYIYNTEADIDLLLDGLSKLTIAQGIRLK